MAAAASSAFPPAMTDTLEQWFSRYGQTEKFEIECRIKDVGEAGFERVLRTLQSSTAWSNHPVQRQVSLDMVHATKVRQTLTFDSSGRPSGAPTFLRKVKQEEVKVETHSGHAVRFQVSSETETREIAATRIHIRTTQSQIPVTLAGPNWRSKLTEVHDGS